MYLSWLWVQCWCGEEHVVDVLELMGRFELVQEVVLQQLGYFFGSVVQDVSNRVLVRSMISYRVSDGRLSMFVTSGGRRLT